MRLPSSANQIQRAMNGFRLLLGLSEPLAVESGVSSNFRANRAFSRVLTRSGKWIAAVAALAIILTLGGVSLVTPRYKSEVHIFVGGSENLVTRPDDPRGLHGDSDTVTRVQLLLSRDLALDVIKKNKLSELPEFDPIISGISTLRLIAAAWIGIGVANTFEVTPTERVLNAYYDRLRVHIARNSGEIVVEF
jgi:uncharacterized protein involved in exopolysaccharide biosynthesis